MADPAPRRSPSQPAELPEPAAADDPRVLALRRLVGVVDRLRAPDGCPWDLEQTLRSMAPHALEEAHELAEAIDAHDPDDQDDPNDPDDYAEQVAGEAGDLLLTVLLVCKIAEQEGRFDLGRAAQATADKLIRRHPHVFGDVHAADSRAVLDNWEAIKKAERAEQDQDTSALAGVPRAMPALLRAMRVSAKAVTAGFRWHDVQGALGKLREEVDELVQDLPPAALESLGRPTLDGETWARIDHELGDVLMAGAFLASYLGRDPEALCRRAVARFERRFRSMESALDGDLQRDLEELLEAWRVAKEQVEEVS